MSGAISALLLPDGECDKENGREIQRDRKRMEFRRRLNRLSRACAQRPRV
jgi:hypothetical protein